ncbi:MAG: hypothetical protein AAF721_11785 [Myxococcota bacterium]
MSIFARNPLSLLAAIAAIAPVVTLAGCQDPETANEDGSLRMGLLGSDAQGTVFRLRDATFSIEGPSPTTVSTESAPDPVDSIVVGLPEGDYTVELEDGWRVEQWDPATDVATDVVAALTSENPADAAVLADSTTPVLFGFFVDGAGPVVIGDGGIEIDVDFSEGCDAITDAAQCDAMSSCQFDPALGLCQDAGAPPASGTVEWVQSFAGAAGATDTFAAVDVDPLGRIVAVGRTQSGGNAGLLVRYDSAGAEQFVHEQAGGRFVTSAFDDTGLAWIGMNPDFGGPPQALTFDPAADLVLLQATFGSGTVRDGDARSGAAFLDSDSRLTRFAPGGGVDFFFNVQFGATPVAVALTPANPAQPFVLSRNGAQFELSQWAPSGQLSQNPLPLFGNDSAALQGLADGSLLLASVDGAQAQVSQVQPAGGVTALLDIAVAAPANILGLDVSPSGDAVVAFEASGETRVVRFDGGSGNIVFDQTFAPAEIEGNDVAIADDGAVYVVGTVASADIDAAILRLAP